MRRAFGWTWKLAGYGLLLAGLIWTGKLSFSSEADTSPATIQTLPVLASGTSSLALPGISPTPLPTYLVLSPANFDDILAIEDWIDNGPKGRLKLSLEINGQTTTTQIIGAGNMSVLSDDIGMDQLAIWKGSIEKTDSRSRIHCQVLEPDSFMADYRPRILLGRPPTEDLPYVTGSLDRHPGLVLLAGSTLVFVHLFFVWARFMLPWREDAPILEEEALV